MRVGATWEPLGPEGPDTMDDTDRASGAMARDFLDAIEHNREPCCTGYDGRWTIEMIAGIYRSQFTGARVAFPLKYRGARSPYRKLQ